MATAHHGDEPIMERFLNQVEGRARREYPEGRVGAHDDGALAFAITADPHKDIVVLDFGKPVAWMGMSAEDAEKLANMLKLKALELKMAKAEHNLAVRSAKLGG